MSEINIEDYTEQLKRTVGKIYREYSWTGVDIEDLYQEAFIGLINAKKKFNPDLNVKFSSYAHYWIRQKVLRYLSKVDASILSLEESKIEDREDVYNGDLKNATDNVVRLCLAREDLLDDIERTVLTENILYKNSYRYIFKNYGIKINSIKRIKDKALKKIRKYLEENWL